jgi:hypothetical protein
VNNEVIAPTSGELLTEKELLKRLRTISRKKLWELRQQKLIPVVHLGTPHLALQRGRCSASHQQTHHSGGGLKMATEKLSDPKRRPSSVPVPKPEWGDKKDCLRLFGLRESFLYGVLTAHSSQPDILDQSHPSRS